jgi:hypothetical protein
LTMIVGSTGFVWSGRQRARSSSGLQRKPQSAALGTSRTSVTTSSEIEVAARSSRTRTTVRAARFTAGAFGFLLLIQCGESGPSGSANPPAWTRCPRARACRHGRRRSCWSRIRACHSSFKQHETGPSRLCRSAAERSGLPILPASIPAQLSRRPTQPCWYISFRRP